MTAILVIMILWTIACVIALAICSANGDEDSAFGWFAGSTLLALAGIWVSLVIHYTEPVSKVPVIKEPQVEAKP